MRKEIITLEMVSAAVIVGVVTGFLRVIPPFLLLVAALLVVLWINARFF